MKLRPLVAPLRASPPPPRHLVSAQPPWLARLGFRFRLDLDPATGSLGGYDFPEVGSRTERRENERAGTRARALSDARAAPGGDAAASSSSPLPFFSRAGPTAARATSSRPRSCATRARRVGALRRPARPARASRARARPRRPSSLRVSSPRALVPGR